MKTTERIKRKEAYDDGDDRDGVGKAVQECINRGILKEYLERKGSEAVNMLLAEYNYEDDVNEQREESREKGRAEGLTAGKAEGIVGAIELLDEANMDAVQIEKKIMDKYHVSREQARDYMKQAGINVVE